MTTPSAPRLASIPIIDVRDDGPVRHAREGRARARALRDECVNWLPRVAVGLLPAMDCVTRRWLLRSRSPYAAEVHAIAAELGFPGIWFLNGCYQWGCTALACEQGGAPWLVRTLDWPFPGLGRHLEVARMRWRRRRFRQRDVAGLCRNPDGGGARSFCRLHQPGSDAAAHPAALAATL